MSSFGQAAIQCNELSDCIFAILRPQLNPLTSIKGRSQALYHNPFRLQEENLQEIIVPFLPCCFVFSSPYGGRVVEVHCPSEGASAGCSNGAHAARIQAVCRRRLPGYDATAEPWQLVLPWQQGDECGCRLDEGHQGSPLQGARLLLSLHRSHLQKARREEGGGRVHQ